MPAPYSSPSGTVEALEVAARHLAAVERAESPAERAAILAAAEAELAPVRLRLRDLDMKLSAYKAETPAPADHD